MVIWNPENSRSMSSSFSKPAQFIAPRISSLLSNNRRINADVGKIGTLPPPVGDRSVRARLYALAPLAARTEPKRHNMRVLLKEMGP